MTMFRIGVFGLLCFAACASTEDSESQAGDTVDGIRAETRAAEGCGGDACLLTTLTNAATNTQLATVLWNADTGTGTLTQTDRSTKIRVEDGLGMTSSEANDMSRKIWQSLSREIADSSSSSEVPYGEVTCTTSTTSSRYCSCTVTVCSVCDPVPTGEVCTVMASRRCGPIWPMYVGYCEPTYV